MRKSFADIAAEADELTRTHHERAATITRRHFAKHPEMATGVNVERRCHAGWWDASRCGDPFDDATRFYYTSRRNEYYVEELKRVRSFYDSDIGNASFKQAEKMRTNQATRQRIANKAKKTA